VIRAVKGFLDVVLERVGDASAGFIILLFSFTSMERYITYVHFICVALIFVWFALIKSLKVSSSAPIGQTLVSQDFFVKDE
jgi:ATP/ADP translocase